MKRCSGLLALLVIVVAVTEPSQAQDGRSTAPRSRPEKTNYQETSRYSDVTEFIAALQRNAAGTKVETFAVTKEGRELPLVILSNPSVYGPLDAHRTNKPIVFIMANIHAGEVEGKEAAQHLIRDVVQGPLKPLLDRIILLVAPIYNADGNDKIDIMHRTEQNGPLGGVGTRENAQGLDLNRDFMKLDSPEARGLVANVFNRWDPHVVIDLHTTNGSYHGYALTFSPALNPNGDNRVISFVRQRLLPAVSRTLKLRHNYRTYFYGNFSNGRQREGGGDPKSWNTFDHRPRFGNNYGGLRNRLAILSEAYSYLDFKTRVDVTDKFVRAVLRFVAANAPLVTRLVREADELTAATGLTTGNAEGFGVAFERMASPRPVDILVGSVTRTIDPRTNRPRLQATGQVRPVRMTEFGEFRATRRLRPPPAYILRPDQRKIVDMLIAHGIIVETLRQDTTIEVERYSVSNMTRANQPFQGHREAKLTVNRETSREAFPPGSFVVSTRQPLSALIFYLLEPESDDGLANWNFFDEQLDGLPSKSTVFPVYRATGDVPAARQLLNR